MTIKKLKKLKTTVKNRQKSLIEAIDKHLYKEANKDPLYKSKPSFRPSDVGAKCLRKVFYRYLRIERDYPWQAKVIRIFNMGDQVHELLYSWLKEMDLVIDYRNKEYRK